MKINQHMKRKTIHQESTVLLWNSISGNKSTYSILKKENPSVDGVFTSNSETVPTYEVKKDFECGPMRLLFKPLTAGLPYMIMFVDAKGVITWYGDYNSVMEEELKSFKLEKLLR